MSSWDPFLHSFYRDFALGLNHKHTTVISVFMPKKQMKPTKILNNRGLKNMLNNVHHLNKDNMHISRSYLILVPPNKKTQYYYLCKDNLTENFTLLTVHK